MARLAAGIILQSDRVTTAASREKPATPPSTETLLAHLTAGNGGGCVLNGESVPFQAVPHQISRHVPRDEPWSNVPFNPGPSRGG